MDVVFWIITVFALAAIGKNFAIHNNGKNLIKAKVELETLKMQKKSEFEERKLAIAEGKVAKKDLQKQIKLVENLLPLKQFDRQTYKKLHPDVRHAINSQMGLDDNVVEAYLRMSDAEIERVKLGI